MTYLNEPNHLQHNVTMNTPLVDPEGFPRADIDVYAIRHARVALNRLRNDHRDVVDRLGRVLEQVYAVGSTTSTGEEGKGKIVNGDGPSRVEALVVREQPLARVNMVSDASPAATAVSSIVSAIYLGYGRPLY
jgi:26S proteasome non-ATPase regulatory subunit 9